MDTRESNRKDGMPSGHLSERDLRIKALNIANEEDMDEVRDVYDLYELASRVHSKNYDLNRDYTLSWTSEALEIWANKQINLTQGIYEMVKPINESYARKIRMFLMSEVLRKITFTRSRDGRTLKAVLAPHSSSAMQNEEKKGLLKKWFSKTPKTETETEE